MTFRVRRQSDNLRNPLAVGGDMTFGNGHRDFLVDSPTAVAQAVYTRLCLWQGEWYLNLREGTPWMQQILGHHYSNVPDGAIRSRILGTPHVLSIADYASSFDPGSRNFTVSCKVFTSFGQVTAAPDGAAISPTGALVMPLSITPIQPTAMLNARTIPAPDTSADD